VGDLSFISLTKVVPALVECVSREEKFETPELVLLVKPQFEVGRQAVARGKGVITDSALHGEAIATVSAALEDAGCKVIGVVESPIRGSEGNTEFLVYAQKLLVVDE
jgi:23S rRNA (cytidine1920-2'-O)/16S rRNA (cytidine1409-2'-O)-methyltransferase